jgi:dipeptidyl aminopeptidase/acylaminoacyl peptidase
MTKSAPYGTWESPITAADVARGQVPLGFATVVGDEVWWQEGRPDEGGRTTIMAAGGALAPRALVPGPFYVRSRVHEYGGKSYLPVPAAGGDGFDLVFANFADQRLYRTATSGACSPAPLTPEPRQPSGLRYADMVLSPDGREVWCVREAVGEADDARGAAGHAESGPRHAPITRAIVAVPLDGSAAADGGAVRELVTGADFFAFPTPSPDGTRLAWISWNHPRMPWDGTELRVGPVSDPARATLVMGAVDESVLAPVWADNDSLYVASDASGWWNLYQVEASAAATPRPLCPREEEFTGPLWMLGTRHHALLADGRLAVLHGVGETRLGFLDPATGVLTEAELAEPGTGEVYRTFGYWGVAASGDVIATVAGGPATPFTVVRTAAKSAAAASASEGPDSAAQGPGHAIPVAPEAEILRREASTVDPAYLPVPRQVSLSAGTAAPVVHALAYPPTSPATTGPSDELPPYVVWIHGGPTANELPVLDLAKAYFTSRGIGVIDVNYGGSTGYGRAYRERLRGQWGVVDVEDAMNAALALASGGQADRARLGIRGGSAGGWTALAAVTSGLAGGREPVFAAAVSYYGVSDLKPFAQITHDFESRYLDSLVGPLPEASELYDERSPIGHVSAGTCPILLLQGMDDPIVPPPQSDTIAADLAAHGIPYAYLKFPGESHGFRKTETIIATLEAELAFYGQIMGFTPPGVAPVKLEG